MKTGRKCMLGLAVGLLLAALPVGAVLAQDEDVPPAEQIHTLSAYGYGSASFGGNGTVDISAHGASVIWISGAETINITGDGEREDLDDERGTVKLVDWEGEIHVEGDRFGVRMVGGKLDFVAEGRGVAYLQGYGTFQFDEHEGKWRWEGVSIPRRPVRRVVEQRLRQKQQNRPVPQQQPAPPAPGL